MSEERLEYLMNQTYYNYLYTDEAQELIDYINQLQQENKQLKERIEYLERSNNRREDTIINLRDELVGRETVLDEIREYINKNSIYFATSEKVGNYFANCNCDDLLQMLDKVKNNDS